MDEYYLYDEDIYFNYDMNRYKYVYKDSLKLVGDYYCNILIILQYLIFLYWIWFIIQELFSEIRKSKIEEYKYLYCNKYVNNIKILQFVYKPINKNMIHNCLTNKYYINTIEEMIINRKIIACQNLVSYHENASNFDVSDEYYNQFINNNDNLFDIHQDNPNILEVKIKLDSVKTNFAELNFYRWVIDSGLYMYLKNNKN